MGGGGVRVAGGGGGGWGGVKISYYGHGLAMLLCTRYHVEIK